jgi:catechol 2,3-dioxygenase-like lactoylglutathione lyase family enzyme
MAASPETAAAEAKAQAVRAIVSFVHVSDVERSVAFYRLLGFEVGNRVPREGQMNWAWLYSPGAADWKTGPNLMLERSERPMNPDAQDVLFYLYANDLVALRNDLIAQNVKVGEIKYPDYLPKGECRVEDPDQYCLMIAQSFEESP